MIHPDSRSVEWINSIASLHPSLDKTLIEKTIRDSAKAAYTAAIMLTHTTEVHRFESTPIEEWKDNVIGEVLSNKLNKLKKSNPEAFFYWWQVDKVLSLKSNE